MMLAASAAGDIVCLVRNVNDNNDNNDNGDGDGDEMGRLSRSVGEAGRNGLMTMPASGGESKGKIGWQFELLAEGGLMTAVGSKNR